MFPVIGGRRGVPRSLLSLGGASGCSSTKNSAVSLELKAKPPKHPKEKEGPGGTWRAKETLAQQCPQNGGCAEQWLESGY